MGLSLSRQEVASPCGFSLPLGWILPSSVPVRVKTFWLTEERWAKYAQNKENGGFFINITAVLSLSGLMGGDKASVSGFREPYLAPLSSRRPQNGKTAA